MKKLVKLLVFLALLALVLPVSNLIAGLPKSQLSEAKVADPHHQKMIEVLGKRCVNCHTAEYVLPFYAKFPVAKGMIEGDIKKGTEWMDYGKELLPAAGAPLSEVLLAKTERVLADGSMPPGKYLMLHWNGGLSAGEKDDLLAAVKEYRKAHHATGIASAAHAADPVQPLEAPVDLPAGKVALGEKMFHDKRLSVDESISCAGCHDLSKGGCDQAKYATGVGKQLGPINSPTVYNSGLYVRQFWDGRAADLAEQAAGPVENLKEMGAKWDDVVVKLQKDAALVAEFKALYADGLTKANVLDAIATFEKSLVTPNSAFDKWLCGDEKALDADATAGYALFVGKGCATCHVGQALGGQSFEKMGRTADYFAKRGTPTDADNGRMNHTKKAEDKHKFKVPTLRNVAVTYPYFHDGSTSDLKSVVKTMGECQLGVSLSAADGGKIVKFLHALTGEYKGQLLK